MKPFLFFATVGAAVALGGCKPAKTETPKAIPAVSLSKKTTEAELAVVTLTPEAEKRLGIVTVATRREKTELTRTFGGELILPLGRATTSGAAGSTNSKSIYSLLPSMTAADLIRAAELQLDADGQIAAATVQVEGAQLALKRADDLVANKAGIGRSVDDARTAMRLAEVALHTAQERRALLGSPVFDAARSGQLWVRVPVYVGELSAINTAGLARVGVLGRGGKQPALAAAPVAVPFSATTNPLITELFFELKADAGSSAAAAGLRPGMKVEVALALPGREESLIAPAAGVLYDIHGNTWVYESLGAQAYTRRRVEVRSIVGANALLARGPQPGAKIVTDGAAELFGTEFGAGK